MRNLIPQLVMCTLLVIGTQQSLLIRNVATHCKIPNESDPGKCEYPADCPAFTNMIDAHRIASRLNFVRQLQCTGTDDGKICCPHSGSYANPWISMVNEEVPCGMDMAGGSEGSAGIDGLASIDDFPWLAMLIYENAMNPVIPGCGGALISNTFVVTAAHCLQGPLIQNKGELKTIRFGEYDLMSNPDCVIEGQYQDCTDEIIEAKPKHIIVHPDYISNSKSQHHDIGLIELAQPIEFTDFIRHICLPDKGSGIPAKKFSVSGWGRTNFFSKGTGTYIQSPIKLKTSLPYVDHEACADMYQPQRLELINGQMCAGRNANDTCSGGSGSPLMNFDEKKGVWILSGLVSMGTKHCGMVGLPGIYTNVNEYVSWIKGVAHL